VKYRFAVTRSFKKALFYLEKDTAVSIDIGTHRLYRE
jgi:hypothetical protein